MLKITKKKVRDETLPHELILITKQETKSKNAFTNILTVIKVSAAQLSEIT